MPSTFERRENMHIFCHAQKKIGTCVSIEDLDFCRTTCLLYLSQMSQCVSVMPIQNLSYHFTANIRLKDIADKACKELTSAHLVCAKNILWEKLEMWGFLAIWACCWELRFSVLALALPQLDPTES